MEDRQQNTRTPYKRDIALRSKNDSIKNEFLQKKHSKCTETVCSWIKFIPQFHVHNEILWRISYSCMLLFDTTILSLHIGPLKEQEAPIESQTRYTRLNC